MKGLSPDHRLSRITGKPILRNPVGESQYIWGSPGKAEGATRKPGTKTLED